MYKYLLITRAATIFAYRYQWKIPSKTRLSWFQSYNSYSAVVKSPLPQTTISFSRLAAQAVTKKYVKNYHIFNCLLTRFNVYCTNLLSLLWNKRQQQCWKMILQDRALHKFNILLFYVERKIPLIVFQCVFQNHPWCKGGDIVTWTVKK